MNSASDIKKAAQQSATSAGRFAKRTTGLSDKPVAHAAVAQAATTSGPRKARKTKKNRAPVEPTREREDNGVDNAPEGGAPVIVDKGQKVEQPAREPIDIDAGELVEKAKAIKAKAPAPDQEDESDSDRTGQAFVRMLNRSKTVVPVVSEQVPDRLCDGYELIEGETCIPRFNGGLCKCDQSSTPGWKPVGRSGIPKPHMPREGMLIWLDQMIKDRSRLADTIPAGAAMNYRAIETATAKLQSPNAIGQV